MTIIFDYSDIRVRMERRPVIEPTMGGETASECRAAFQRVLAKYRAHVSANNSFRFKDWSEGTEISIPYGKGEPEAS